MGSYNCVPAIKTVPPCPSGTAPDVTAISSPDPVENYLGMFDHIPLQDLQVGVSMVLCLVLGIMSGRR